MPCLELEHVHPEELSLGCMELLYFTFTLATFLLFFLFSLMQMGNVLTPPALTHLCDVQGSGQAERRNQQVLGNEVNPCDSFISY